jgi:GNAT superfamily N-acetyltransferase
MSAPLELRRATDADLPEILALLAASMEHRAGEPHEELFRWKHLENPFGPSPSWVACEGERIIGFRTFLRWQFVRDGSVIRAARAVDTATHPDHQGRGIFTKLTRLALDDLRAEGVQMIFNTPNDKSRPGYLKMGWTEVGRVPTRVGVGRPGALLRIARSRVPASLWSIDSAAGESVADVLSDAGRLVGLRPPGGSDPGRIRTDRTVEYLRWRYGLGVLHYRAVTGRDGVGGGVAIFRLRHRGPSVEAVIADVLVPGGDLRAAGHLVRRVRSVSGADYALAMSALPRLMPWFVLPVGPVLTALPLDGSPAQALGEWAFSLGDIELF